MILRYGGATEPVRAGSRQSSTWILSVLWLLMLSVSAVAVTGCGGCNQTDEDPLAEAEKAELEAKEKAAKQKEKPKPPFEDSKLSVLPDVVRKKETVAGIKPGHWSTLSDEMKANNSDFVGELHTSIEPARGGGPLPLEQTPFTLNSNRPASLQKGAAKSFDISTYVPRGSNNIRVNAELRSPRGGSVAATGSELMTAMKPHQYFLVLLSARPESFINLPKLDSIRGPGYESDTNPYRLVVPKIGKRVPLPSQSLAWTSISHLIWDDIDPGLLEPEQQQAMLDWLHWGGQLIISGPGSLDKLKGSFLDPSPTKSYLPALAGEGTPTLSAEQLATFAAHWPHPTTADAPKRGLSARKPWPVIELIKQSHAQYVPLTEQQVIERMLGRGRVVVTSFRLGQSELLNWSGFDSFFNAVLLRRPPRMFFKRDFDKAAACWLDKPNAQDNALTDARISTQLRYLSRDLTDQGVFDPDGPKNEALERALGMYTNSNFDPMTGNPVEEPSLTSGSGMAGWNDFRGVATEARRSLREAAGISIPNATFVTFVLAVYLVVLVPFNYLIFRVFNRVEWAWIAAPAIAIAGALAVVKLAQLDIGFARSQTEVAVLEVQGDYPRAHLARYTALYSSLSTTYDLIFDDQSAVALPFADPKFERLRGQGNTTVVYQRDGVDTRLTGFAVDSNSTAMVHSEQMFDLGGSISLVENAGRTEIFNRTKFPLLMAGAIRRTNEGVVQVAWLGDLAAGIGAAAHWTQAPSAPPLLSQWNLTRQLDADGNQTDKRVHLGHLLRLAQNPAEIKPGEVRLIATMNQSLPGLVVEPEAAQNDRSAALVVANLKIARPAAPQPDANTRADIVGNKTDEEME